MMAGAKTRLPSPAPQWAHLLETCVGHHLVVCLWACLVVCLVACLVVCPVLWALGGQGEASSPVGFLAAGSLAEDLDHLGAWLCLGAGAGDGDAAERISCR